MPNFDAIRLFATVAIVLLHTAANGVNRLPLASNDWWLANIVDSACRAGVPLFLMLTGALFLRRADEPAKFFYQKRQQRLLWPLLFWSLFYLLWSGLKAQVKQQPLFVDQALQSLFSGAPYFHLWFFFMLAGVYLVLPPLRQFWLQLSPGRQTLFCLAALMLQQSLHGLYFLLALPEPPWPFWFIGYLPYLLLGAWLTRPTTITVTPTVPTWRLTGAFALLVLLTAALYHWQRQAGLTEPFYYAYHRLSLPVLAAAILLWHMLGRIRIQLHPLAQILPRHSLGIYCLHPVFLDLTEFAKQQLGTGTPQWPYFWQLLLQSMTVLTCSVLVCVLYQRGYQRWQRRLQPQR